MHAESYVCMFCQSCRREDCQTEIQPNLSKQAFVEVYKGKEMKQRFPQLQPATEYTFRVKV